MLLDTNALIWMQQDSKSLGRDARRHIESAAALYFSPISVLEIEIKRMKKAVPAKLRFYEDLVEDGFTELKLSGAHAEGLRTYPQLAAHDPFDRVLLATAEAEGMKFMTGDARILSLGLPFVIDAQV